MARWENPISPTTISRAKERIRDYYGYSPRVLDPFAGGGSIPLEALRLGCETYASDYNPVSNLIVKATTEYPFRRLAGPPPPSKKLEHTDSQLILDVKKWSKWVLEEARKDLARFFPAEKEGEPMGYLWSRCIPCQTPDVVPQFH